MGIIGNSDDLIATQFLSMKHISSNSVDNGFLPTFGPCFVNFYGAPREFGMFTSDFSEVSWHRKRFRLQSFRLI